MMTLQNKRRTVAPKRPLHGVLTSFVVAGFSSAALANPQNHTVVEGNTPVVTTNGSELNIATDGRTILNWDSFSIGSGERTRFVMSGADRAVLNRVTGGTMSQIDGMLESNGRVYLINPNGVLIGANGLVNTQSFIASTRDIADEDFLDAGELTFSGTGSSEVHNLGTIQAADGDVALIGKRVVNSGFIGAPQGVIALAAGDEIMLAAPGSSRLLVRVEGVANTQATLIAHTGVLNAAQAELQAAGGNMYSLAVNAAGVINATGVQSREGRIYLTADGAQINVPGSLTAINGDGSGGSIHIDSGVGFDSAVLVSGALDVSSTSTGGGIHIDSSRVELNEGTQLMVSGGSGNAGGVFIGSEEHTNQLIVAEGASIEANSISGDAGHIDLSGAGVYFHGELQARGGASQAQFNIHSGEALEYTGLADLRAYGNETRFGSVNIESAYANLTIAPTNSGYLSILDSDALAAQLNYGNVQIVANGNGRYIDVFAPLSWQSATRLTLQADGTIDINEAIDAGSGALHLISRSASVTDQEPATITVRDLWLSAAEDVNLANRVVAQNVTLYDIGGRTWLTNEQNQLGAITFMRDLRAQSGEVDIVDSAGGLSLTTSNVGGITYSTDGNFRVRTSGDLTLLPAFQTQAGGDVTLVAAGGVLLNQSTAGANVFGTSSTGLGRTRVYATGVGVHGGLEGPAQYNVSYVAEPAATANTGFYYSGSAPQDPGPSDPVDPVDPVDPPHVPERPPTPPSQIIQTALDGNSFEQLNRPAQNVVANYPAPQLPLPPPPNVAGLALSSALTDHLERLAQVADIKDANSKQPKQPSQQAADQIDDALARVLAFLQQLPAGAGGGLTAEQLTQNLGSLTPEVAQLLNEAPGAFQQQVALFMAQHALEQRNAALDLRSQATSQHIDQMMQAAEQMRNAAIQQLIGAMVASISQMTTVALSGAGSPMPDFSFTPPPGGSLTQPMPPMRPPLPMGPPLPSMQNMPQPGSGMFGGQPPHPSTLPAPPPVPVRAPPPPPPPPMKNMPSQPGKLPPPMTIPMQPVEIPSAVQAQVDAFRVSIQQGR
jgi:filamentous hemagglutinin family protein